MRFLRLSLWAASLPLLLASALNAAFAEETDEVAIDPPASAATQVDHFVGTYAKDGRYEEIIEIRFDDYYTLSNDPYRHYCFQRTAPGRLSELRFEENPRFGTLTLGSLSIPAEPLRQVIYADFGDTTFLMVKQTSPENLLINAAQTGGLAGVRAALNAGADPNAVDSKGISALELACRRGRLRDSAPSFEDLDTRFAIVGLLLKSGAKIAAATDPTSFYSYSLITDALRDEQYELARLLLDRGGNAEALNLYSVLRAERRRNAAPNFEQRKIFDELLATTRFDTKEPSLISHVIFEAIASDDAEYFVKELLEAGLDLNVRNYHGATPLIAAIMADKREIVRMLLNGGSDPSVAMAVPESDYMGPDALTLDGLTPLQIAAARGDFEIARMLLDATGARQKRP